MLRRLRSGLVTLGILGAFSSVATADPKLSVTFKTTAVGALYTPQNIVAIWIEGPSPAAGQPGPFVKTIGRWADLRKNHLVAWQAKAGLGDADAVSGATRADHGPLLTATWDLKDKQGNLVPDGLYTIRMETADGNSTAAGQNWQGTFTFTKGLTPDTRTVTDDPHYPTVMIDFNPTSQECNNNVVDPGETCDPPGSCPVACEEVGTACAPVVLVGSASTCNASCAVQAITACLDDDGCCAEGCTAAEDSDCAQGPIESGCAAGTGDDNGAVIVFALVGALGLVVRRRRG